MQIEPEHINTVYVYVTVTVITGLWLMVDDESDLANPW